MMSDSYNQKNSLFNAMTRFIGAVNNMDQTVMVPSLLRDVPLDDGEESRAPHANDAVYFQQDGDMYSSYVLLKSIRNDMEWGVLQGDEHPKENLKNLQNLDQVQNLEQVEEVKPADSQEDDLEKQFRFHLNGLHSVLSKLTLKANTLTNRYKEEIGCRN